MTIAKKVFASGGSQAAYLVDQLRDQEEELFLKLKQIRKEMAVAACSVPVGDDPGEISLETLFRFFTPEEVDRAKCRFFDVAHSWLKDKTERKD